MLDEPQPQILFSLQSDSASTRRRFYAWARALEMCSQEDERAASIAAHREAGLREAGRVKRTQQARLRAAIKVLSDLALQGWRLNAGPAEQLSLTPPTKRVDPLVEKSRVRAQLHIERDKQLNSTAVRDFVRRMEAPRLHQNRHMSIVDLMRDGGALLEQIEAGAPLADVIQPYLQFVDGDERCPQTGRRVSEIWRYFRHTWATPYKLTPGRSMMILVRDRAVEPHPVIGIAALASPTAQIRERDQWIGWTPRQVQREAREAPTSAQARWLQEVLEEALSEVYVQDFFEDGLLAPSDLRAPREGLLELLVEEGRRQREAHNRFVVARSLKREFKDELSGEEEESLQLTFNERLQIDQRSTESADEDEPEDLLTSSSWEDRARSHLYRSKRAKQLVQLLRARRALNQHFSEGATAETLKALVSSREGARAISDLVRKAKADRMGVHVAEISVCGSVPPYNELLGGKLVSMMLASPEVQRAYRRRYGQGQSVIASARAGRPIIRAAELSLLMTTSLYGSVSSQYNRIKIPCERVGGEAAEQVTYKRLGLTQGFGTSHFGDDTVEALALLISQEAKGRRINSIFGEGVNPRLRKVREGLDLLGFPSNDLLRHGNPRVIYGVSLVSNLTRHLLGVDERPEYLLPQDAPEERTQQIVSWWRERWLARRVRSQEILARLAQHRVTYPLRHGARVPLADDGQLELF